MWKPPQRIRHELPVLRAPSAAEAGRSRLFSPLSLASGLTLHERTWVPAMVPWRATEDGFVTRDVLDWYGRFADGQPGTIVVEATGIRDVPSGPLLRIGHDRFLPGLRRLVDSVRQASEGHTRLFIQLIDFLAIRRRPDPEKFFARFLEVTDEHRQALGDPVMPEAEVRARLRALSEDDLLRVLTRAGFDGVELHYAHAYTMASFLSRTNIRDDGYGGTRENRVRLPLEVFAHVRQSVRSDFAVGCRFLAEECIDGGNEVDDAVYFGVAFARAGMDFISTSRGGKFDDAKQPAIGTAAYPYTGRSGYECMPQFISDERGPFGRNAEPTAAIRSAVRATGSA